MGEHLEANMWAPLASQAVSIKGDWPSWDAWKQNAKLLNIDPHSQETQLKHTSINLSRCWFVPGESHCPLPHGVTLVSPWSGSVELSNDWQTKENPQASKLSLLPWSLTKRQPLKYHLKMFIKAIVLDFVLLQSTTLRMKIWVGYGGLWSYTAIFVSG